MSCVNKILLSLVKRCRSLFLDSQIVRLSRVFPILFFTSWVKHFQNSTKNVAFMLTSASYRYSPQLVLNKSYVSTTLESNLLTKLGINITYTP